MFFTDPASHRRYCLRFWSLGLAWVAALTTVGALADRVLPGHFPAILVGMWAATLEFRGVLVEWAGKEAGP